MTGARWTNGILATWLAWSAFLGFTAVGNVVNAVTVGSIVAGVGLALIQDSKWQGWTATVAGLWLITAALFPFLQTGTGLLWNSLLVAAAVLVASFPLKAGGGHTQVDAVTRVADSERSSKPSSGWQEEITAGSRELVHH